MNLIFLVKYFALFFFFNELRLIILIFSSECIEVVLPGRRANNVLPSTTPLPCSQRHCWNAQSSQNAQCHLISRFRRHLLSFPNEILVAKVVLNALQYRGTFFLQGLRFFWNAKCRYRTVNWTARGRTEATYTKIGRLRDHWCIRFCRACTGTWAWATIGWPKSPETNFEDFRIFWKKKFKSSGSVRIM